jgi:CO/xanthine dehydrogenase Mo-binding subunit
VPDEGRLVVWSSTQAPECVQKVVAKALDLPMHDIQVTALNEPARATRIDGPRSSLPMLKRHILLN